MNKSIGTSKRKLFNALAEKIPDAQIKYDFILTEQKEKGRKLEEEFKAAQPVVQGTRDPTPPEPKESKKKNKKKK